MGHLQSMRECAPVVRRRKDSSPGGASDISPALQRWVSFRHYALREFGIVEIESEWTARDRETQAAGGPARVFLSPG